MWEALIGFGDNVMATGMARGHFARGKLAAFGSRYAGKIMWDQRSAHIFRNNPNIAPPGSEGRRDLEWIQFYKGSRLYNSYDSQRSRWIWNYDFRVTPGEMFFDEAELEWAEHLGKGYVVIEPNVEAWKSSSPNKQWPLARYDDVSRRLRKVGVDVLQFQYGRGQHFIPTARRVHTPSFRHALAALQRAKLYIGPEGGLHHGAAAVGVPGVVIFGGFVPPQVTGYEMHTNLVGNATDFCGSMKACSHCKEALDRIHVHHVLSAAEKYLEGLKLC